MFDTSEKAGRNIAAITLIGVGLLFLLAQTFNFSFIGLLWPFFVIVPGLVFLYAAVTGDKSKAGMAVPGAMVTGTGVILFYQNLTGHWASWAYIWALYPVFLGFALTFIGRRTQNASTYATGNNFVKFGLMAFVGFWVFFELLIFGGRGSMASTLVPLVLIAAGVYMLFRRGSASETLKKKKNTREEESYNAADINPSLRRQIDEVLSETEDIDNPEPRNN